MKVVRKDGKKEKEEEKTRKSFSSFSRAANTGNMVKGFCQVQLAPVMSTSQNSDTNGEAELGKQDWGTSTASSRTLLEDGHSRQIIPSATGRYGISEVCGRAGQGGN